MEIGIITNPNSRKNRGRPNRAAQLQSIVGGLGEVHQTHSVESIKPILRDFLRKRARYWVADGGDGALHWMIRAGMEVLEEAEFKDTEMPLALPTKGGTIDFVANNVGINGTAESILSTLRHSLETGRHVEEVEVDSMKIEGVMVDDLGEEKPFRTWGFAVAAGGVGQRFFSKFYAYDDPNPAAIMKVVANTLASIPVAMSPLRNLPFFPKFMREYARDIFKPTLCRVSMDGMVLPGTSYKGLNIASMSINLGGVFRFFTKADEPGLMHVICGGELSPLTFVMNLPRMHAGKELVGEAVVDRACRELKIEATGDELLAPIIDGEYYHGVSEITFSLGPRVRIPKISTRYN